MFTVSEQGWGISTLENVYAVLNSVRFVMAPCFKHNPDVDHLFVGRIDGDPITYKPHGVILLNSSDREWVYFAYQFAHEYCHYLIARKVPQQIRWFEESLCQLSSYYFLDRLSDVWGKTPPYPNWRDYAPVFRNFAESDQRKALKQAFDLTSDAELCQRLILDEYDRATNAYAALLIRNVFEETPTLWSVVPLLSGIPDGFTILESFRLWQLRAPEGYRQAIGQIASSYNLIL